MSKKLNIGLFGFGVVGQGLYDIIKTKNLNLEIKKIAIKNPEKKRSLPADIFTTDRDEILNNPEINTIVEFYHIFLVINKIFFVFKFILFLFQFL